MTIDLTTPLLAQIRDTAELFHSRERVRELEAQHARDAAEIAALMAERAERLRQIEIDDKETT